MPVPHVNPQVTDAITETNVTVVGEAPAMGLGSLYQTLSNSVSMAAANAVFSQQQANVEYQAASTHGVSHLLSLIP
jgi:Killing trait